MKRFLTILTVSLLCVSIHAQKKLFQKAIEEGRQPNRFYVLHNDKNRMVKLKDLKEFADKNGYILGKWTGKEISRFGDVDNSIETMEFLPISEYESYIFSNIKGGKATDFSQITNQGSAYCYMGWDNASVLFSRVDGINWSGQVNNGVLEGSGVGYFRKNTVEILFVEGTFEEGFPVGETTTYLYDMRGKFNPFTSLDTSSNSIEVGKMHDGMAIIEKNDLLGFVNNKGVLSIPPKYKKVVEDFKNGQAIVIEDVKEIIIDKKGQYVDLSPHQKLLDEEAEAERRRIIAQAEKDNELGMRYYKGIDVEKDYSKAAELFQSAAEAGNADAQSNYGECLFNGTGVSESKIEAVKYFKLAAEQGQSQGQYQLGHCYENAIGGLEKNMTLAEHWYRQSANQGNANGQNALGSLYFERDDFSNAFYWFEKSALQGHSDALDNLGLCYENGYGCDEDNTLAVKYYQMAAEMDDPWGQYHLANCYRYGNGVQKSTTKALEWFRKSEANGNSKASNEIEEIEDEKARAAKIESFKKRLGYDPTGTSITTLVSTGRNIKAVIDYIDWSYVDGYDWFINLSYDGGSYKSYKLYRVTSTDSDGTRHGTLRADISAHNGKIDYVSWQ